MKTATFSAALALLCASGQARWAAAIAAESPPRASPPAPAPRPLPELASLGAELIEEPGGILRAARVLAFSPAESISLKTGDRVVSLAGRPVSSRAQAAQAWRSLGYRMPLSAVVLRGDSVVRLREPHPRNYPLVRRKPSDLSDREKDLAGLRLSSAATGARAGIKPGSRDLEVSRGASFWARFLEDVTTDPEPGRIVEAEVVPPTLLDENLDFVLLPAGSRVWALVTAAGKDSGVSWARLLFFKARLEGGAFYLLSAAVTEISGNRRPARVSSGGTLVAASGEDPKRWRVKASLLDPLILTEPEGFFRSGPGLWIEKRDGDFRINKVVAGRSAQAAGLLAGDILVSIDGVSTAGLDFGAALRALYGKRGSLVKVGFKRGREKLTRVAALKRGVLHDGDKEKELLPPYGRPSAAQAPPRSIREASRKKGPSAKPSRRARRSRKLK